VFLNYILIHPLSSVVEKLSTFLSNKNNEKPPGYPEGFLLT